MAVRKRFQTKTQRFQIKTLLSLLVLIALVCVMACSKRSGQSGATGRHQGPLVGVVLVYVAEDFTSEAEQLTALLAEELERRRRNVELLWGHRNTDAGKGIEIRPKDASGELKKAWDAYYQLEFSQALKHLQQGARQYLLGSEIWAHQEVLRSLVHFAQGKKGQARRVLQTVRTERPDLTLHEESFPPQFLKVFASVVGSELASAQRSRDIHLMLKPDQALSNVHAELRRVAEEAHWSEVWAIRFVPIGWNQRIDLHRVSIRPDRKFQSLSVEIEVGASRQRVVRTLLGRRFDIDTTSQID